MATSQAICVVCHGQYNAGDGERGVCGFCRIFGHAPTVKTHASTPDNSTINLSKTHLSSTKPGRITQTDYYPGQWGQWAKPKADEGATGTAIDTAPPTLAASKTPNPPASTDSVMTTLPTALQTAFFTTPLPAAEHTTTPSPKTVSKGKEREQITDPPLVEADEGSPLVRFEMGDFCLCEEHGQPCSCGENS
ncbi:MAG: hypothetical protein Q9169_004554 [Polycauliona sp. 2 TL-2023]